MNDSEMEYELEIKKEYKGKVLETKFIANERVDSNGNSGIEVTAHYFVDGKRVTFKQIDGDKTIANFRDEIRNDAINQYGIDPLRDWIYHEIEHLSHMIDHDLVEILD